MVVFPNCKINLGLRIVRKRNDGFHDLETVFYPVPLRDVLESTRTEGTAPAIDCSGIPVDGKATDNICIKAWQLLRADFPELPAVQFHLYKSIPTGAGLGGGSADGAFALALLNRQFNLALSQTQLLQYAFILGSDCPFFIINQPCHGTGRGEVLTPVQPKLDGYELVLVNPGIHINTGWAFSQIKPAIPEIMVKEIVTQQPVTGWRNSLINDFEVPVFAAFPAIAAVKEYLYNRGAVFAAMSGSGSSVFGLFSKGTVPALSFADEYFVKVISL